MELYGSLENNRLKMFFVLFQADEVFKPVNHEESMHFNESRLSLGLSRPAAEPPQGSRIHKGQSRTSLEAGLSRTSLDAGHSRASLEAGHSRNSLEAGHGRTSLEAGHGRTSLEACHSRTSLETGQNRGPMGYEPGVKLVARPSIGKILFY